MTESGDNLGASPFESGLYNENLRLSSSYGNSYSPTGEYFANFSLTNIQALHEKNRNELLKMAMEQMMDNMGSNSAPDIDDEWELLEDNIEPTI